MSSIPQPTDIDRDLVSAMTQGDERAAAQLYDRHGAVVYGLALRMVKGHADAEEIVLDTFAQAWNQAARFEGARGSVVSWLMTIARSRALDLIRAGKRRDRAVDSAATSLNTPAAMGEGFKDTDALVHDSERSVAIASALDVLPDAQRRVIELAFFEGLTHPEVAARVQEPLGTVKTRIRLGLHKLRDVLAGLAPEGAA